VQRCRPLRCQFDNQTLFPDVAVTVENGFAAGGNCVVAAPADETQLKNAVIPMPWNRRRNPGEADQKRTSVPEI
jgi:hypothetical protein